MGSGTRMLRCLSGFPRLSTISSTGHSSKLQCHTRRTRSGRSVKPRPKCVLKTTTTLRKGLAGVVAWASATGAPNVWEYACQCKAGAWRGQVRFGDKMEQIAYWHGAILDVLCIQI